jgi:hypothetical protein
LKKTITECTKHIAERHHSAIFFGLFFGITDYIFTQYGGNSEANPGPYAMSKGSALSAMLWCGIIVYTIDRRWVRAGTFCVIAAAFAGIGIIHQSAAFSDFREGTFTKETSAFEFMVGYLSMAGVCVIYWALQTYMGKTKEPGEAGYEDDHGYLPEIHEPGVDNLFATWWEPAEKALLEQQDDSMHISPAFGDAGASDEEALEEETLKPMEGVEEGNA